MLMGLPQMPIWQQFKSLLEQHMHDESVHSTMTTTTPAVPTAIITPAILKFTFESCVSHITSEAAHHMITQHAHSSCPGSEYANATTTSNTSRTNTITSLRMHRHNPQGIFCTTPGCNKGDHDHAHCYGKGGGMEGQVPWMKNKKKDNMNITLKELSLTAVCAINL